MEQVRNLAQEVREKTEKVIQSISSGPTPTAALQSGVPISDLVHSQLIRPNGPLTLDHTLLEIHQAFNREKIPERIVHADGGGAFGYFEVTKDMRQYCAADFLNGVGKQTPVFMRFSTVTVEKGFSDSARDPRGFAIKFYTQQGNYDLVCNNLPVFFVRDPMLFPQFIHSQKRNPRSNLKDMNAFWDFLSLVPESAHMLTMVFSDRGTPYGFRHMHGFGNHTFKWLNKEGEQFWVKYHFLTDAGIKNFTWPDVVRVSGEDADFAKRDLFEYIENGNEARWSMYVQIIPAAEAERYHINIHDNTKVIPHADYPLIEVGKLALNRNVDNYFQDVEQAAFHPGSLVPGIEPSLDPMFQARLIAYHDAHMYRLGVNFWQIPVNKPINKNTEFVARDGQQRIAHNGTPNKPNYYPNSFNWPAPQLQHIEQPHRIEGFLQRAPATGVGYEADPLEYHDKVLNDFEQPRRLWLKFSAEEKHHLIDNLYAYMKDVTKKEIQLRQCKVFSMVHEEYGARIAAKLGFSPHELADFKYKPACTSAGPV